MQRQEGSHVDQDCPDLMNDTDRDPFEVGDSVYLRPLSGRCDLKWSGPHRTESQRSAVSLEIGSDGVSRHVSHVRLVSGSRIQVTGSTPIYSSNTLENDAVETVEGVGDDAVSQSTVVSNVDAGGERRLRSAHGSDVDEGDEHPPREVHEKCECQFVSRISF